MIYSLTIRKEAEADLAEAYEYYELCHTNLGSDLLLCIEEAFERITKSPLHYQIIYKDIRRSLSKRFPYGIYYTIRGPSIIVLAVLHARKEPMHWKIRS